MTDQLTELRVGDEGFLVSSMIERCPKIMMLRELVKNALEAAATAAPGARRVKLSVVPIDGVSKLAVWNSGRGMTADELFRMADIASSIRKQHRLDQNFGMGAKVASLPSNRHGMRYRSCHDGVVHEVMLGQRGGVYGRLRRPDAQSVLRDVLDVTASAQAEGQDTGQDWTEVVLLGNTAGQDTVTTPYEGGPWMPWYWVAEELAWKFFRIAGEVELVLDVPTMSPEPAPVFRPFAERLATDYTRTEAVTLPDGVVLHYVYDGPREDAPERSQSSGGELFPTHGLLGLVYRDEIYDRHSWGQWLQDAPIYGVPFGARWVSVFIELPDGYGIVPDGYRQFLRYAGGEQAQVQCRHFVRQVMQNRPEWLIALIEQQAPASNLGNELLDDLNRLMRRLNVRRRPRQNAAPEPALQEAVAAEEMEAEQALPPGAVHEAEQEIARAVDETAQDAREPDADAAAEETLPDEPVAEVPPEPAPEPERPPASELPPLSEEPPELDEEDVEPVPQILVLRDDAEIDARGIQDRAARYYPETHQLFLNARYRAVAAMRDTLRRDFFWVDDQGWLAAETQTLAEQALAARVARTLVFALSKHGEWHEHELSTVTSTSALSIAADDYEASLPGARASLRAGLDLRDITAKAAVS